MQVEALGFPLVREYNENHRFFEVKRLVRLIPAVIRLATLKKHLKPHGIYPVMCIPNVVNLLPTSLIRI